MAFKLPTFNLVCRIITAGSPGPFPLPGGVTAPCQLRLNKAAFADVSGIGTRGNCLLLLPAKTDIRAAHLGAAGDAVEVPNGSGLYYTVLGVADVARGFPNEHRAAYLRDRGDVANGYVFPIP